MDASKIRIYGDRIRYIANADLSNRDLDPRDARATLLHIAKLALNIAVEAGADPYEVITIDDGAGNSILRNGTILREGK